MIVVRVAATGEPYQYWPGGQYASWAGGWYFWAGGGCGEHGRLKYFVFLARSSVSVPTCNRQQGTITCWLSSSILHGATLPAAPGIVDMKWAAQTLEQCLEMSVHISGKIRSGSGHTLGKTR